MSKKLFTDLKTKGQSIALSGEYTANELGRYYIDFGSDFSKLNKLIKNFDQNGIPVNASYIDVPNGKPHYYPISIGQVGLSIYHEYLRTHNPGKREHFLRIADWFVQNHQSDPVLGSYWLTDVPKPEYQVYTAWKSAFTQSRAISILLRAWQETSQTKYKHLATGALLPFTLDIAYGGVAIRRSGEEVFYEEYVADYPTRVLDGHIFALFGLYDYIRAVPEAEENEGNALAKRLFDEGIQGLLEALPKYDLNFWIQFNRCEVPGYPSYDPCTINYLQLVCGQLNILYEITGINEFEKYQTKFLSYLNWSNIIRMYRSKYKALKNLNRI